MFDTTKPINTNPYLLLASSLALLSLAACMEEDFESLDDIEEAERLDDIEEAELLHAEEPSHTLADTERLIWPGPQLSSEDEAPMRHDEYDVIALSDTVAAEHRERVLQAAQGIRSAVYYSVQEDEHVQFVVAVPSREAQPFVDQMLDVLSEPAAARTVCNRLYKYYFWAGSQFMICGGEASGSHGYTNLGVYGFNNHASSFFVDSTSNLLFLYDGYNYTNLLKELDWDVSVFPGSYNNKASSAYGYY